MILSIVTINYNNLDGLKKTFNSLQIQKNINKYEYEYIVIDGLSTDGSHEEIKENNVISKYIIEKDDGIADAFNKGIDVAGGKYIYFLNSGDIFYNDNSLEFMLNQIKDNNYDILINKIAMVNEKDKMLNIVGSSIDLNKQRYRNYLPHQGMIIKKELFNKYGLYDKQYRLGMDYEWSVRLLKDSKKLKIKFLDKVICRMLEGGISQTQYVGTFMAYHRARVKNKIMISPVSYMISLFFIVKRSVGIWSRKWLIKN